MRTLLYLLVLALPLYAADATNELNGVYNVKDYGATGGCHDLLDDTTAVQSAIDACDVPVRKGTVLFPPGCYRISQTLTMRGCSLVGNTNLWGVIVNWAGAQGGTMLDVASGGNNKIHDIAFRASPGEAHPGTAIHFTAIPDTFFSIRGVALEGFTDYGIDLANGWWNFHVRDFRCDTYDGWCVRAAPLRHQNENGLSFDNFEAHPYTRTGAQGFLLYDMSTFESFSAHPSPVHLSNGIFEVGPAPLVGDKAVVSVHRSPGDTTDRGVSISFDTFHAQDDAGTQGAVLIYRDAGNQSGESFILNNVKVEFDQLVGPAAQWDVVPPIPESGYISWMNYHGISGGVDVGVSHTFYGAAGADVADRSLIPTDPQARFQRNVDGRLGWGDGLNPIDTTLYRGGPGILKTDGLIELNENAAPAASNPGTIRLYADRSSTGKLTLCIVDDAGKRSCLNPEKLESNEITSKQWATAVSSSR